jgi:uncharacterized protein
MIRETIVTTVSAENDVHVAPMGVTIEGDLHIIAPFKPSTTLDNLRGNLVAVVNYTDDVRVFAGCLTGRRNWPTRPATRVAGAVLQRSLAHAELEVTRVEEDDVRPRFHCVAVHVENHAPFRGFNRAQAAVVEAAILVSRLHMLQFEKVKREIAYLEIAIGKTAGPAETEAWGWLMERIAEFERETFEGKRA